MAKIEIAYRATPEQWDEAYSSCSHATFFHSRNWAELWSRATRRRMRPAAYIVEFEDGKRALVPLTVRRGARGLVRSYYSAPAGTYGGWLTMDQLTQEHALTLGRYMVHGFGRMDWRVNPYDALALLSGFPEHHADETHAIDLRPGFVKVHKAWSKGHKAAANQARREGITVRQAHELSDWQDYWSIYQSSLERWGDSASSRQPRELFEELGRLNVQCGDVRLWLAETRNQIVAGALCLYSHDHVSYWHGAALESHFPKRPVHLLMHEAIQDACARGLTWFDMNPSGNHEGVRDFKKGFGAQALYAPTVKVRPLWRRVANEMRDMAEKMRAKVKAAKASRSGSTEPAAPPADQPTAEPAAEPADRRTTRPTAEPVAEPAAERAGPAQPEEPATPPREPAD